MKGNELIRRKVKSNIEFYQTPPWATLALLEKEKFEGSILEPCCGAGAISRLLKTYYLVSSDIRTDDDVFGYKDKDIFAYNPNTFDNIITNPPYFIARQVAEKSLQIAKNKIALLLRLSFLESRKRYEFFKSTPLQTVYVFCKRVTMHPEGTERPKNSGTAAYAWYVWNKRYSGKPMIDWIR